MRELEIKKIEAKLKKLALEGQIRLAKRPAAPYLRSPISSPAGLSRALLDAERDGAR